MRRQPKIDPGEQQIDAWETWLLAANRQRMQDDGLDADTIARDWPAVAATCAAVASRMREDFRLRRVTS